jgi:glycosyltransferase involved in cell wall biosynthesis
MKLAALFSHPIQYFSPLFRRLAAHPGVDLTVFYCSRQSAEARLDPGFGTEVKWDIPLLEGYNYRFLSNLRRDDKVGGFFSLLNPDIFREIRQGQWDALWIHGYMHAANWLAIMAARSAGVPVLLRGESNLLDSRPGWRRALKSVALRLLLRQVDGALYIGSRNREYYRYYGLPEDKLHFVPYCVDNEFFQQEAARLRPQRPILRRRFGVADHRPLILFCGKLIPKKQPVLLLQAFKEVRRKYPCALVYAGDGILRREIEELTAREGIPDVHVSGFLNQSTVSQAYAAADVLALPSAWSETWGLVLNEGMNFGLPMVASDRVGGAVDLVREGENGYIVPHHDTAALALALARLVEDPVLRARFGRRSLEIIQNWGLDRAVAGIVKACNGIKSDDLQFVRRHK